ncbi:MAG TPA: hypothetical protein DDZ80_26200 [Cyanobacteria bacterium UBA8803]|nr:hypothetical protein [Cyanobacteria bacterium UBA9273]HBL61779.1 hypothetical protein [Cyanobacteria bacterium UBA8803]
MNSQQIDKDQSGKQLKLPEPDPDNITVLTQNLPNKPILPWHHYDSPWSGAKEENPEESEINGEAKELGDEQLAEVSANSPTENLNPSATSNNESGEAESVLEELGTSQLQEELDEEVIRGETIDLLATDAEGWTSEVVVVQDDRSAAPAELAETDDDGYEPEASGAIGVDLPGETPDLSKTLSEDWELELAVTGEEIASETLDSSEIDDECSGTEFTLTRESIPTETPNSSESGDRFSLACEQLLATTAEELSAPADDELKQLG